jgi:BlaI family transcriptional regulator, penicillinase repressor
MVRLNELEEQILDALWELGNAFPKVLMANLKGPLPPYNTVLSAIRKLEKEGYIGYKVYGKSHEYYPILGKEEYGRSIFKKFYNDILNGSKSDMLSYFMKEEKINLKELEKLIDKIKNENK